MAPESTNAALVRDAYDRYEHGDLSAVLQLIDPDLEWTYLDPSQIDHQPQVCHGRQELAEALARQRSKGLRTELVEVFSQGDQAVVVTRTPGLDAFRARKADDLNIDVLTVQDGRVIAIRACRNRAEAMAIVGLAE